VRRERLLVAVELLRAIALATILAGLLSGLTAAVYAAIAVSGLLGAISPVAVSALIPRLVPTADLPSANGLNGVIESTAMATGAVAGGALLALVGIGPALALDLITFLLAAVLFAGIPAAGGMDAPAADSADAGVGAPRLRDLLADRTIVTAIGALCITVVASGLVNATLPRFLTEVGLSAGAYGYGFGAIALGLALGGAIAGGIRVERANTGLLGRTLLASAVVFCALAAVTMQSRTVVAANLMLISSMTSGYSRLAIFAAICFSASNSSLALTFTQLDFRRNFLLRLPCGSLGEFPKLIGIRRDLVRGGEAVRAPAVGAFSKL